MNKESNIRENNWKEKAVARQKEIQKLKKRIDELVNSRNSWKRKYMNCKSNEARNGDKKRLNEDCPKNHHYPTVLILLCLRLFQYGGTSLRGCRHFLTHLYLVMELETGKIPSHTTVRLWICKMGLYLYEGENGSEGTWVLIADESISVGENKVLLVLGLRTDTWEFKSAAGNKDIHVLYFGVSKKWEGGCIAKILDAVKSKYTTEYVVSDRGNNLLKAYRLSGLRHVPDCTHALAKAFERYCTKCPAAAEILSSSGKLRQKWHMGRNAVYCPPPQRKKARFHNLSPVACWSVRMLFSWTLLPEDISRELGFLKENKEYVKEFIILSNLIDGINKIMKTLSYTDKIHRVVSEDISRVGAVEGLSQWAKSFINEISGYLDELKSLKTGKGPLFCCSDIIESTFGKLKYKIPANSPFGITEFTFALASLGTGLNHEEVKNAMENSSEQKVKDWAKKNLPESLFEKKRKMIQKVGEEIFTN